MLTRDVSTCHRPAQVPLAQTHDRRLARPERAVLTPGVLAHPRRSARCDMASDTTVRSPSRHHGDAVIDRIEQTAPSNQHLRYALSYVWASRSPVRPRLDVLMDALGEPRAR
jgi:hypothetical protein